MHEEQQRGQILHRDRFHVLKPVKTLTKEDFPIHSSFILTRDFLTLERAFEPGCRIFMSLLESPVMNDCGHGYFAEQADPGNRQCTADSVFRINVISVFEGVCYKE